MMTNVFSDSYTSKQIINEIQILRKLSTVKENLFTTKILDVIVPKNASLDTNEPISYIFLVMEL